MRWMHLWLYLLGAVTFLVIALRRVLNRQGSLNDEIYSKQVAIEYVHSGVAWVRADGTLGSVNPALAHALGATPKELVGREWRTLFPENERPAILEDYRKALLMGRVSSKTRAIRQDGSTVNINLMLVAVHNRSTSLVGHYCLIEDRTYEPERKLAPQLTSEVGSDPMGRITRALSGHYPASAVQHTEPACLPGSP